MGVHGLWGLLQEAGRPLDPKTMEGKVMAVDISIWLNMAVKGSRDYHGHSAMSAHLVTLFHRICKLLHMGIKPVFVFDGKPPQLKRRTLAERRRLREENQRESAQVEQKRTTNLLKKKAIELITQETENSPEKKTNKKRKVKPEKKPKKASGASNQADMFNLPPLSSTLDFDQEFDALQNNNDDWKDVAHDIQELASIEVECADFSRLPDETQYELLRDIKEINKRKHTSIVAMPDDSQSFSTYQIKGLLNKNKLTRRMGVVEKRMSTRHATDTSASMMQLYEDTEQREVVQHVFNHHTDDVSVFIHSDKAKTIVQPDNKAQASVPTEVKLLKRGKKLFRSKELALKMKNKIQLTTALPSVMSESEDSEDEIIDIKMAKLEDEVLREREVDNSNAEFDIGDNMNTSLISNTLVNDNEVSQLKDKSKEMHEIKSRNMETIVDIKIKSKNVNNIENKINIDAAMVENKEKRLPIYNIEISNENDDNSLPVLETNEIEINIEVNKSMEIRDDVEDKPIETVEIKDVPTTENNLLPLKSVRHEADDEPEVNPWLEDELEDLQHLRASLETESSQLAKTAEAKQRAAREVSNSAQSECKDLLKLFGIPFVMSPEEAEAQCACLESIGLTSGSITDDSDIWLFGSKVVVKDMFNSKRAATFFNIKDIEEHLHLTRNKMIVVALCSGSDYTTGVLGVGPKTTLEIIKEFEGEDFECLKKFKQWCQNVQDDELKISNKKLQKLRGVKLGSNFPSQDVVNAYLKPVVDESTVEFTWGLPDVEGLREFAEKSMGWSRTKLNETLLPVIKRMHSCVSKQSKHVNINRKKTKMANAKIDKFLVKRTAAEQKEPMLSEPSSDSE